jgi:hypothetical protein
MSWSLERLIKGGDVTGECDAETPGSDGASPYPEPSGQTTKRRWGETDETEMGTGQISEIWPAFLSGWFHTGPESDSRRRLMRRAEPSNPKRLSGPSGQP